MIFLNPLAFWALLFIAVPILVHLFNFQKPKRLLFSNLAFVREVNKVVQKKIKLKQWILLILRILAITMLVLAFTNPVWFDKNSRTNVGASRSVVILLDNSWSMEASDARGNYLLQSKTLAREIVKSYETGTEFQVQNSGNLKINAGFMNATDALVRLENIEPQSGYFTAKNIAQSLPKLFQQARNPEKTIYILSDFQRSTFLKDSVQNHTPSDIKIICIPVGNQALPNVYVTDLAFENTVFEPQKPVNIRFQLHNDSEKEIEKVNVKVNLGQKVVALTSESLLAGQKKEIGLSFTAGDSAWQSGNITLDDEPIHFDNIRAFSLHVPAKVKVLYIKGQENSTYLELIFQQFLKQFQVTYLPEAQMASANLSDYQCVILSAVKNISSGMTEKFKSWVKDGGGMLVFPGNQADKESWNAFGQALEVGTWSELVKYTGGNTLKQPDIEHPLFENVFVKNERNVEAEMPLMYKQYAFSLPNKGKQRVILQNSNGVPAFLEAQLGDGKIFAATFFPTLEWTNFPIKAIFFPVIHRAALLAAQMGTQEPYYQLNRLSTIKIRTTSRDMIKLKHENGTEFIPEQYPQSGSMLLSFDKMNLKPGNYSVIQNQTELRKISFNISDEESALQTMTKSEIENVGLGKVEVGSPQTNLIRNLVQNNDFGLPLWKWFVVLALLFLIAEIFVLKLMRG